MFRFVFLVFFSVNAFAFEIPKDLLGGAHRLIEYINSPQGFNYQECPAFLSEVYNRFTQLTPNDFDVSKAKNNSKVIIQTLFEGRIALLKKLRSFPVKTDGPNEDPCVSKVRDVLRLARFVEDYLGETSFGVRPYNEKTDPKTIGNLTESPGGLLNVAPQFGKLTLRSGDLIASRGMAFTSAAIARITEVDSQFSHVAMIYIEDNREVTVDEALKSKKVWVLEEHIDVGATVRHFQQYVGDNNGRNLVLRYPDSGIAHRAAQRVYRYLKDYRKQAFEKRRGSEMFEPFRSPDFNLPYNFSMDMSRKDSAFCSQIVSIGFKTQNVTVPLFPSFLKTPEENDLVKTLGVKVKTTFAPGDIELDTRFDVVAEWRDLRKLQDIRYRDAILVSIFQWMKDYHYSLVPKWYVPVVSQGLVWARQSDFPFAQKKLPKNMTVEAASTISTLDSVGKILLKHLQAEETLKSPSQSGMPLTLAQITDVLERYRIDDAIKASASPNSDFHELFRPR